MVGANQGCSLGNFPSRLEAPQHEVVALGRGEKLSAGLLLLEEGVSLLAAITLGGYNGRIVFTGNSQEHRPKPFPIEMAQPPG